MLGGGGRGGIKLQTRWWVVLEGGGAVVAGKEAADGLVPGVLRCRLF